MTARIDLSEQTFGRLVVQGYDRTERGSAVWRCRCACGEETFATSWLLRSGQKQSCGCLHRELLAQQNRRLKRKHGHSTQRTHEYRAWCGAKKRCENPADKNYSNYGGRGIQMAEEWRTNFEAFLSHIGPCPSSELSLDRIDNNRGYEPGNVRWATRSEQRRNQRRYIEERLAKAAYDPFGGEA